MRSNSIAYTAVICSVLFAGCGLQNMNHTAKSQSYQNMGNQGYNLKLGQNSARTQSDFGNTYTVTRKTLDGQFDLYRSNQLEAKLNRAGIMGYSVLATHNTVILGLSDPHAEIRKYTTGAAANKTTNTTSTTNTAGSNNGTGAPTTTSQNLSSTSQKGFGTSTAPSLSDSSNKINGVPVKDLQTPKSRTSVNQTMNQTNQIPVNPSLGNNSSAPQSNQTSVYRARGIIENEMGPKTDIIVVSDQAGVDAVLGIKQKLNKRGTPQPESFHAEVKTLENSINR